MEKVKILVCTHKQWKMPVDEMYIPIHVGKSLNNVDLGYYGDNTGDNISVKNKFYSELTAHYWAWKNLSDYKYIGLVHYRRYLDLDNESQICCILNNYDIILPNPLVLPFTNIHNLQEILTREDVYILMTSIKRLYPEYMPAAYKYLCQSNKNICCNMFVTSRKIFNEYSEWLFELLFETEKYVKLSGYSRMRRIFGYYSEALLPIYVIHNNLKVRYKSMIEFPGEKDTKGHHILSGINNMKKNLCFLFMHPLKKTYSPLPSTIVSMENDNIPLF